MGKRCPAFWAPLLNQVAGDGSSHSKTEQFLGAKVEVKLRDHKIQPQTHRNSHFSCTGKPKTKSNAACCTGRASQLQFTQWQSKLLLQRDVSDWEPNGHCTHCSSVSGSRLFSGHRASAAGPYNSKGLAVGTCVTMDYRGCDRPNSEISVDGLV